MKERPILFSAPMVRAILDGRKTQTRRVIKNVPSWEHFGRDIMDWDLSGIHQEHEQADSDRWCLDVQCDVDDHSREMIRCPYGAPGDRLWVRETWGVLFPDFVHDEHEPTWYRATDEEPGPGRWRPSIHMPRARSRIDLEVTGVRVERLHQISDDDALREGIDTEGEVYEGGESLQSAGSPHSPERYTFATLWRSINGDASWESNPWVWVVEFKRVRP